jgi:hypothetical protein
LIAARPTESVLFRGKRVRGRILDRIERPWLWATLAVALMMGGLLIGYEPVGGDPDRIFRPIKSELARALRAGHLPFWSDRFGLGVPLVAESHAAAFYPLNLILYRMLDVSTAYRWAMWLHYVAMVGTTYLYARRLGLTPWGSSLAGLSFTFCGFQAVHSSHEWAYHSLVYLPLSLYCAEEFLASGRIVWLAGLALTLGVQLTVGHFQSQAMTWGLVILTGLWRVLGNRRLWRRGLVLVLGVAWGAAIAAVQLALSGEFAAEVSQTNRPTNELAYYAFPPAHWIEPALPLFFRGLIGGAEAPYWTRQGTTGFEIALYVGTIPFIFACIAALDRRRPPATGLWRLVVPLSFAVATMPRWWLSGYLAILQLPGLGYFRVPARYTLITCFGLAILAGQGFDRTISTFRYRAGMALAIAFALGALAWGLVWSQRSDFHSKAGWSGMPFGVEEAALAWVIALVAIVGWRRGRVGPGALLVLSAIELGMLYYRGTTEWGWEVPLPSASPILSDLAKRGDVRSVAGSTGDLPVRAGLTTASPYVGFTLGPPHSLLKTFQERLGTGIADPIALRWLRRFGVSHGIWETGVAVGSGVELIADRDDPALDELVYRPPLAPSRRRWRVVRYDNPFPFARVALRAHIVGDERTITERLSSADRPEDVWFWQADLDVDQPGDTAPRAKSARVVRWEGSSSAVEHDGSCDLVLTRAFNRGWRARVGNGPEQPVVRADGGLQAIRLTGAGTSEVSVRYESPLLWPSACLSIAAVLGALVTLIVAGIGYRGIGVLVE